MPIEDIYYFESVEGRSFAYCEKDVYEVKARLGQLEDQWEQFFIRVSRTVLLNWVHIACLRPMVNARLKAELDNGEQVVVTRQYVPALKEKFGITKNRSKHGV